MLPKPFEPAERERLAADTQSVLFSGQEPLLGPVTLPESMARAIKYQADYRQRQMEEAAAAVQLDVAKFDMLPRLALNAGYSVRNNDAFGFGFTSLFDSRAPSRSGSLFDPSMAPRYLYSPFGSTR